MPLRFQRSPRARRASLRVDPAGRRIVLVVPERMSRATALAFAASQALWIARRLDRLPERRPFVDGAIVPYRGEPHRLRHRPEARGTVWIETGELHVAGDAAHLDRRLRDWLAARARETAVPLVQAKAARAGRKVTRLTIRDMRSRWGSCGRNGAIALSWRLILAPPEVLDYLVAHEVAHLVHPNHSPRFWAEAARLCDGSLEAAETWLKRNGESLFQYGAGPSP